MGTSCVRGGFAYLMALLVVLVVAGVALSMASGAGMHLRAAAATAARTQCRTAAMGVLRAAVNDLNMSWTSKQMPALITVQAAGEPVGDCTVVLIGRDPLAAKAVSGLIPMAGRIDVNRNPKLTAGLPGMSSDIAAAISDWIDAGDVVDPDGGAERSDGAYAGAAVPYAPRNAAVQSLDELRLVRGVTPGLWFGEDANANGRLDAGEDADGDGRLDAGLRGQLSLQCREPRYAPDGKSIRTSITSRRDMTALFTALFPAAQAKKLGERIAAIPPPVNRLQLIAALDLDDDDARQLWPWLSGPENRQEGLLDALAASEDVLAAVAGSTYAKLIIAARPNTGLAAGPNWLADALGETGILAVGSRLTIGSYQFTADLLAVRNDGAGWARIEAVIDASTNPATITSIRPAETLGWPFPWATPEQIRRAAPADVATFLSSGQP